MFGIFGKKKNIDAPLIGWFRLETEKLLGLDSDTYNEFLSRFQNEIKVTAQYVDAAIAKDVGKMINDVSTDRYNEIIGEFFILLFVRHMVIVKAHQDGEVKESDVNLNNIATVLLKQTKIIIEQLKQYETRKAQ